MNLRYILIFYFAGLAIFESGCAGLWGPNGLGERVLLVWKITPAQKEDAEKRSRQYFTEVANHQRPRPWRRYVALKTLPPNPKQEAKYVVSREAAQEKAQAEGQPLGSEWVEPSQLHCIMVFDAVTQESVGDKCYVVGALPNDGEVSTYETFPAEFIATSE
jgi:hypothetical protein